MGKYLYLFRIVYLILLLFIFANFILCFFGYAFTPLLWNPWLYLGAVTILCHSWYRFYRKHAPNWSIVFQRGSLLDAYDEYHELVNPFVMKKEIKKKVYID